MTALDFSNVPERLLVVYGLCSMAASITGDNEQLLTEELTKAYTYDLDDEDDYVSARSQAEEDHGNVHIAVDEAGAVTLSVIGDLIPGYNPYDMEQLVEIKVKALAEVRQMGLSVTT